MHQPANVCAKAGDLSNYAARPLYWAALFRRAVIFEEGIFMSDAPSLLNLSNPAHPVNRTLTLIKLFVLAVSGAAEIPAAPNLYSSWMNGVPFSQVDHRLAQAALLEKNFSCKIDYRSLATTGAARVEVGSCARTGDISIRVTGTNGQVNYEWIAFEQLPKPASRSAHLGDLFVAPALAVEAMSRDDGHPATIELAQAVDVLCESKKGDNIVRIVQSGGQCVRETVSIFRGAVEKREPVACDKSCPIR